MELTEIITSNATANTTKDGRKVVHLSAWTSKDGEAKGSLNFLLADVR